MSHREAVTPLATGGDWGYDPGDAGDAGHSGSREVPPDPGYPPCVYAVVADPETKREHDVPIAVMDFPVYEDEPDPLDQHDEGVRQEGYPHENARLCSLIPANIRAMREALACCRDGDPAAAAHALDAALADVDAVSSLIDLHHLDKKHTRMPAEITVTTRREPATHDKQTLAFWRAWGTPAGVLENLAKESGLPVQQSGSGAEQHMTLRARTARERGALTRFLILAYLEHLTPYLRIETGRAEDRELVLGLGLGERIFEPDGA